jgi:hypothetical protein
VIAEAERLKHKFDDEGTAPAAPRSELSSYSKASESALGPVAEAAEEGAVVAPPVDASAPAVVVPPLPLPEMSMPSTLPEEDESEEAETARLGVLAAQVVALTATPPPAPGPSGSSSWEQLIADALNGAGHFWNADTHTHTHTHTHARARAQAITHIL